MKRWKKFSLVLLVLVLLSQIPFVYRRYQLGRLNAAIISVQSQRQTPNPSEGLRELRGVAHVHSFLGGHSTGTFQDIIAAANSNKVDFVLMSEHPSAVFNTSEMTLKGQHAGVLFVNGNEVKSSTGDRLLLFQGDALAGSDSERSTQEVLSRRTSGLAFVAYPEEFMSWEAKGYNGVEVYNVYTNAQRINPVLMFFDGLWSYWSYPDLLFATFYTRPSENLKKWDAEIIRQNQKLVAIAGNDSHSNVGISLNDASGKALLGLKLDPYERSFRLVRLHVLIKDFHGPNLSEEALLHAISLGNCFIGYDLFGDTSGFRFTAQDANETRIMGDQITLADEVRLTVNIPVEGRILLLKDGVPVRDQSGINRLEFKAKEKGSYRVEIYLPQLPEPAGDRPWIISNPIYVK